MVDLKRKGLSLASGWGLAFYLASALIAEYWGRAGMHISQDFVPFGYFIFLFGSYLMGTSAAMLQVVINPYIAAYPLPGTQPVQRMNFTCAVNSFGTTIAPFFVTGVMFAGVSLDRVSADQLTIPFLVMMLIIAFTTWSTSTIRLLPGIWLNFCLIRKEYSRITWQLFLFCQ